jgi:indolepyruvate ferredoxin oxidoreductase beta subunit
MKTFDIVLIGVGGQGIVTLGDLIASAALAADVPVSYVPTKGMAQRGGFVKVEIRLGHANAGPRVPDAGAHVVVSMERSEALKGVRFARPDGRFILYDHVWEPAGVMLGEDDYPSLEAVVGAIGRVGCDLVVLDPAQRPSLQGWPAAANITVLGALFAHPSLNELIPGSIMEDVLVGRWPKAIERNLIAFRRRSRCRGLKRYLNPGPSLWSVLAHLARSGMSWSRSFWTAALPMLSPSIPRHTACEAFPLQVLSRNCRRAVLPSIWP